MTTGIHGSVAVASHPRDVVAWLLWRAAVRSPSHHLRLILLDVEAWWFRTTKCQATDPAHRQICGQWWWAIHWHPWMP